MARREGDRSSKHRGGEKREAGNEFDGGTLLREPGEGFYGLDGVAVVDRFTTPGLQSCHSIFTDLRRGPHWSLTMNRIFSLMFALALGLAIAMPASITTSTVAQACSGSNCD